MSNSTEIEETTPKAPLSDRIKSVAEKSIPVAKVAALSSVAIFFGAMTIAGLRAPSDSSDDE
jgi:hypothetical protein|nr:MAG TPA: hypothetical protein [Caudoviricetes sp.]